jgi:hypothetical protein
MVLRIDNRDRWSRCVVYLVSFIYYVKKKQHRPHSKYDSKLDGVAMSFASSPLIKPSPPPYPHSAMVLLLSVSSSGSQLSDSIWLML